MPCYSIPSHITHQTIDGEVIAIHFGNGTYYSMRETAAAVWQALAAGQPGEGIANAFADAPADAGDEILAFIRKLREADLIAEAPAGSVAPGTALVPSGTAWAPPELEAFTDLSQLLLADPIHDVTEAAWPNLQDSSQA